MATVAPASRARTDEHRFFLLSALAMAFVLIAGFSTSLLAGRSSFGLPAIYHVHAGVFIGWIALYVTQNALVAGQALRWHRRLGWLALLWLPVMVALAITVTVYSARDHGGPPVFDVNSFLIGNSVGVLTFAALAGAAITLRRRSDWHRRLMFCSMAAITGPGFGRLLPMPFLIPWGWWVAALIAPSIFPVIGMIADRRRSGRVHPAWFWGWGFFTAMFLLAELFAYSRWGLALTDAVIAGTPGAARPMAAFFPR
ncbi:hypothetical protein ASE73_09235 [Sphingomonas sp. Leaf24]|uniref:hypothetical protein n=1 Tax=unclassified Sphingomonas TaxID=196159 RepID=UPI0006F70D65|nr:MULTISPECIES: hypothetical protein [unclassified Sphingomonas]KQM17161.1 hypothetical protein ASE50_07285 [Sphingomonas sp. Leaf5]KQM88054.1 hypothetical protein ASE73_09235 [Sphingomonas sp. Leaf24]